MVRLMEGDSEGNIASVPESVGNDDGAAEGALDLVSPLVGD